MRNFFGLALIVLLILGSCGKESKTESVTDIVDVENVEESTVSFDSIGLRFTAFKTPKKVGVPGTFNKIDLKAKSGSKLSEVMDGATFTIETSSVNTNNPVRDGKLKQFFFGMLENDIINGEFKSFTESGFDLVLEMNNIKNTYTIETPTSGSELKFNLTIDILADYTASKALSGINTACYELHEGKTWEDVDLEGYVKISE